MKPDIKELFHEADTRKHQQWVAERMIACAKKIMDKAMAHDESKFSKIEKKSYVEPVWFLNTGTVKYGSDEYKRLTAQVFHQCISLNILESQNIEILF